MMFEDNNFLQLQQFAPFRTCYNSLRTMVIARIFFRSRS